MDDFPRVAKQQFGDLPEMDAVWPHFKPPSHAILDNFWATLDHPGLADVIPLLEANPAKVRGVAYEGAAMGLTLLDFLLPYRKRLKGFLAVCGVYKPMVYVGAGMILPYLPTDPLRVIARFDDPERWLILDGFGFFRGFFAARDSFDRQLRPDGLSGESARNFDSGLGRSLYFVSAANPDRIAGVLQAFPESRRRDLWGGVGLACGYTGGALDREGFQRLLRTAGPYAAEVAVGLAVAAGFREQTNHPADHTDGACDVFWGLEAADVARLVAAECAGTHPDPSGPRYDAWRQRVKAVWTERQQLTADAGRADR
ncbi:DUF1702 family protein [Nocardia sp. CDC153]|uniref:DUF1702 family protein n=1 Tax=Nocardia sp. CDC153 TaxID=3112167 RepID=UPI002DBEEC1A|nr:DUF1702 family protein [Nocardia sp. CDC153]MEC3957771.1 DUF1702 family protein [Nocardia sp. CDC153]